MPTSNTTTNAYNPAAYKTYNAFQPMLGSQLTQMALNPLGSSFFQNQLAQLQKTGQQLGRRNISNLTQNAKAGGNVFGNAGNFLRAQLQRGGIANSLTQSNAFNSAMNNALAMRQFALGSMQGYQPLQTGEQSHTGGFGTWATPILGAAVSLATQGKGGVPAAQIPQNQQTPQVQSIPAQPAPMQNPFGTGGTVYTQQANSLPY